MPSPFLTPGSDSQLDKLALLHLRRDHTIPAILRLHDDENPGYEEGNVTNTRFGSFPHSTLFNKPWGSQIIASKVDTGSRGRVLNTQRLKRKADELDSPAASVEEDEGKFVPKKAIAASSGFLHILYPTPELWTASLPHRTQVVYTPDYSYVLHRLGVRPGSTLIEAGAGSGSFTHAAVRAVFNGYPEDTDSSSTPSKKKRKLGKVCSFEFHAQRAGRIRDEIQQHGLKGLVHVTHRDVYQNGFLLPSSPPSEKEEASATPSAVDNNTNKVSPKANAIFLDLPAPWLALKHLVRHPSDGSVSPLDPTLPVHICTFSPCLEQVQRTISALRQHSWLDISMVEVMHKRIEVKREKTGLEFEGVRGATVFPRTVNDAVTKMRVVEERSKRFRESLDQDPSQSDGDSTPIMPQSRPQRPSTSTPTPTVAVAAAASSVPKTTETEDDDMIDVSGFVSSAIASGVPSYAQGRLVHRTESELKTHTSYLVFAVLPREWTEEDENKCREKWPSHKFGEPARTRQKSKKQMKREAKAQRGGQE